MLFIPNDKLISVELRTIYVKLWSEYNFGTLAHYTCQLSCLDG